MFQKVQKPQNPKPLLSDGWVILQKAGSGGWREFPDVPRMVFRTQSEARVYARQVLGWPFVITRRFWVIPWLRRWWKVVPFRAANQVSGYTVYDMLGAAVNRVSISGELGIKLICECGPWNRCGKRMEIPMGLYEEGRVQNCVFRHKDCSVPPEVGEVFVVQSGDCQVWQEGEALNGK